MTLAFGEIIGQVVANGGDVHLFGGTLTAGPTGIAAIDRIDLPFVSPSARSTSGRGTGSRSRLVALTLVVNVRLRDSRLGRAWVALREDEAPRRPLGVPIVRTKLLAYGSAPRSAGVAGAFLASYLSTANPHQFRSRSRSSSSPWSCSAAWARSGASWSARSPLSLINNYLLHDLPSTLGVQVDSPAIAPGVYGFLLVIVMLLRPAVLLALAPFHASSAPLPAPVQAQLKAGGFWHAGLPGGLRTCACSRSRTGASTGESHTGQLVVNARAARPLEAGVRQALRAALPDPSHALADVYGPTSRPPARRRRHGVVRVPAGGPVAVHRRQRHRHLVDARLRAGRRPQPGREPLRRLRPEPRPRGEAVPRPLTAPPRDGDAARDRGVPARSAGAGAAPGPATRRTTCTSPPPGTEQAPISSLRSPPLPAPNRRRSRSPAR